ncbi:MULTISPECIES: hypothetical protein [Paenibacillus]|uniref:hypothetical protein n=1 Tax=Paenibacillus TaxID=44249 RepID=UPI00096D24E7|nr:hypothetical protein [Paenibacillus odorifer]OMD87517.1 hypothetical protein BSK53_00485 [Paenibacillus odorifer]
MKTTQVTREKLTPIETLIKRASIAVSLATGGDIRCKENTGLELRRIFLELVEDGAWEAYKGNGEFEDGNSEMHVSEMSDRWIARKLIQDYE